jgi:Flp pilus assembly protein TadG
MDETHRRGRPHRLRRGQSLVEFAITVPILALLLAGTVELGRGYSFAVATSDAARDAARFVAGKTTSSNGPGLPAMCNIVTADLAAVTSNISCPVLVTHAPPFAAGTDFTAPAPGHAVVVVYCGSSVDCTGATTTLYQSEVDVGVYYGFSDLNLLGGGITIAGSGRATTSW